MPLKEIGAASVSAGTSLESIQANRRTSASTRIVRAFCHAAIRRLPIQTSMANGPIRTFSRGHAIAFDSAQLASEHIHGVNAYAIARPLFLHRLPRDRF